MTYIACYFSYLVVHRVLLCILSCASSLGMVSYVQKAT